MDRFTLDIFQLWHPFPDILAIWIKLFALQKRVEDAEKRLRIHTC